jgi:hypothetical protein
MASTQAGAATVSSGRTNHKVSGKGTNTGFLSQSAVNGGTPTIDVDVPICAVFLCLYATGSVLNVVIFFTNRRRGHHFLISWFLNVFCLIRVVTCAMRISWARDPTNSHLSIAATVFSSAGILFIYIINLVFSQRILRAKQPAIGWNHLLAFAFKGLYGLVIATLFMGITVLAISINTTNPDTLRAIRNVSLATTTFIAVITLLPLVIIAVAYLFPKSDNAETFGTGSIAGKTLILSSSVCLAIVIAGFKAGTTWESPRLATDPAWYQSKAAYYCFSFMLEIPIVALFLVTRVDKRFHVPDHSNRPGDYSRMVKSTAEK